MERAGVAASNVEQMLNSHRKLSQLMLEKLQALLTLRRLTFRLLDQHL